MDSKRRKMGDEDVSELRQRSRFSYLQKREAEQLALLRRQVAEEAEEEERLGSKLSKDELRSFQRNRETLRLAEARNAIDEHLNGYSLPDANSNRSAVLNRKHNEKEKGYEKSEVQLWEDEQLNKIKSQVKRPQRVSAEDYDYVFDTAQEISWTQDGPPVDLEKQRLQATLDEAENKARTIEETRKSLPIYQYKQQFLDAVAAHQILVLVGQTGSGKTTQLTQYLAEAGYAKNGRIGCTQPRRVAAMSVAIRVSEEMGTRVGQDCGYSVRFESKYSESTKIIYQTDGLLTRTLLTSPMLEEYSAIILDEAHERTVSTEILMALLKEVCAVRKDFRLIVASATLVASDFSDYFGLAPIMNIPGRTFPISKFYASSPEANYLNAAVTTIFQIHLSQGPGDILVFFSGEEEIVQAADFVASTSRKLGSKARPLIVAPVYGALPSEAQQLIFQQTPEGSRKVVLATNIAETSLTIDGIKYVVDSGFCKQMSFNPKTGMNALVVEPCSRASADQRAGRAGRTGPGMVFRLYTKYAFYNELPPSNTAEILRVSLDGPLLTLKSMGINDILGFDLMAKPSPEHIIASLENLYALGYLDSVGNCSKLGRRASELPLDPRLSKVLLSAENLGCVEEAITLVAMVQESGSLFFAPKDQKVAAEQAKSRFASAATEGGDLIALLKVWNEFVENDYSPTWAKSSFVQYRSLNRVRDVRDQLMKLCERVEISTDSSCGISDHVKILKCFTSGYFANVARLSRDGQSYSTLKQGLSVYIHPSSCLAKIRPKLVVFAELVLTSKEYMRNCAPIDSAWLSEVAPHYHKKAEIEALDVGRKMPKERLPAKAAISTK